MTVLHPHTTAAAAGSAPEGVGSEDRSAYDSAYARALSILAGREHSARELNRKLAARGFAAAVTDRVTSELQHKGLQSDERFTEMFVRRRVARGQGPIRIRQELAQRGVNDELIEAELTCSADYWVDCAQGVLDKHFHGERAADRTTWNRQARFLARRGFPADLIYRVLGNL